MPSAGTELGRSAMPEVGSGRRLVLSAGIYVVGTFLHRGLLFASLPIYARLFGVDDYGRWSLFIALVAVGGIVFDLAWSRGIPRLFYEYWQNAERGREYLLVSFVQRLLLSAAVTLAFFAVMPAALPWVSGGVLAFDGFGASLLIAASAESIVLFVCSAYRARQRAIPFVVLKLAQALAQIGGSLAAAYWLHPGVETTAFVFAAGSAAIAVLGAADFVRTTTLARSGALAFGATLRANLAFSTPLVFHDLASWLRNAADPFIVAHFLTLYAVSIYHVGYQFGLVIGLLLYGVELALSPYLFQMMKSDPDFRRKYLEITHFIVGCTFALVVTTILFSNAAIRMLFPESLVEAARIAPLIAAGYFFHGLYTVYVKPFVFHARTEVIPLLTAGPTVVGVLLSIAITPRAGVLGPAVVTIFSLALLAAVVYRAARKLDPFAYPVTLHAILGIVVVALGAGCSLTWQNDGSLATGAWMGVWAFAMLARHQRFFRGSAARVRAMVAARPAHPRATIAPIAPLEREHEL